MEYEFEIKSDRAVIGEGAISPEDIKLFRYVETAEETWEVIAKVYPGL